MISLSFTRTLLCHSFIQHSPSLRYYSRGTKSPSFHYCFELVKKKDNENFWCTLLLPKNVRSCGLVLRAFNAEVASVQEHVSESITGQMRFQFWLDTIDKIYDGVVPEHPICQELAKVIQTGKVSKLYLQRMILSRKNYLKKQFKSLEEAEEYSDWSNSSLYFILLELCEIKNIEADHAASHLGKAQGLSIILRSVPFNSRRNCITLPQELLLKHKVSHEDILRFKTDANMKDLVFEMASVINQHLEMADQIRKKLKRKIRSVYLPAVSIQCYLENLRSVDFNMFDPRLQLKNEWLTLKLLTKKFLF